MIIAIGSDLHLEHSYFELENKGADILILAGDIFTLLDSYERMIRYFDFFADACDNFKYVVYIAGNHEHYHMRFNQCNDYIHKLEAKYPNFIYLRDSKWEYEGITFLGNTMWSNQLNANYQSMQRSKNFSDFYCIKNFTAIDAIEEFNETTRFLAENTTNNSIVVTHHAPSERSVHARYKGNPDNGSYYSDLDSLILATQPKLWIHGHMHDSSDYKIGGTRIICNPRGYPRENPAGWDFKYIEVYADA